MSPRTLYDKLWNAHLVREDADGSALLYIDRHLVHEVTSPQAFEGLRLAGRQPWRVDANLATPDHNVPTTDRDRGIADPDIASAGGNARPELCRVSALPSLRWTISARVSCT